MEKSMNQIQMAWGPNILLGLIMAQTVCKGFQQRKPADKELFMQCTLTFDILRQRLVTYMVNLSLTSI